MGPSKAFAVLILVAAAYAFASGQQPDAGLGGAYACRGTDIGGGAYEGTLDVRQAGQTYQLKWTVSGRELIGVGLLTSNGMAASFSDFQTVVGLVVFVSKGGELVGQWTAIGAGGVSTETCRKGKGARA